MAYSTSQMMVGVSRNLVFIDFFGESLDMSFNQEWIKKVVQTFRELFGNGCKCLLLLRWLKMSDSPLHLVSHLAERSEGFHSDPCPFNHHEITI